MRSLALGRFSVAARATHVDVSVLSHDAAHTTHCRESNPEKAETPPLAGPGQWSVKLRVRHEHRARRKAAQTSTFPRFKPNLWPATPRAGLQEAPTPRRACTPVVTVNARTGRSFDAPPEALMAP